jgi:hypothetical protein
MHPAEKARLAAAVDAARTLAATRLVALVGYLLAVVPGPVVVRPLVALVALVAGAVQPAHRPLLAGRARVARA